MQHQRWGTNSLPLAISAVSNSGARGTESPLPLLLSGALADSVGSADRHKIGQCRPSWEAFSSLLTAERGGGYKGRSSLWCTACPACAGVGLSFQGACRNPARFGSMQKTKRAQAGEAQRPSDVGSISGFVSAPFKIKASAMFVFTLRVQYVAHFFVKLSNIFG